VSKIRCFVNQVRNNLSETNRSIGKIGSISAVNGLLAFVKSIFVVQIFGISRDIEIYFAAIMSISTIDRLYNIGTINEIFIPTYISLRDNEKQDIAMSFFSLLTNWFLLFALLTTIVLWFSTPLFINVILPGFSDQEIQQTATLFRALVLCIPLKIFNGMCSIPFRANKIYTVHELTGIISKFILITLLLFAADSYGVKVLVLGIIIGIFIRFFYILYLFKVNDFHYTFLFKSERFPVKWLLGRICIPFFQTIGLQVNRWIVLAAFSLLPAGILAIYQYVEQLYSNFYAILIKSLKAVFLTEISTKDNLYNKDQIFSYLMKVSLSSLFTLIIAICVGKEFLQVIWESNEFNYAHISLAYILLIAFFVTMFIGLTQSLYLSLNIARGNINRQYIGTFFILLLSSLIFVYMAEEIGFYAIVFRTCFIGIAELSFAMYINYLESRETFVVYNKYHLMKAMAHGSMVILVIYVVFDLFNSNIEMTRIALLGLTFVKALAATVVFWAINKYLKVYDFRLMIRGTPLKMPKHVR
jgi:putative peptidoglycan lipid II flippase